MKNILIWTHKLGNIVMNVFTNFAVFKEKSRERYGLKMAENNTNGYDDEEMTVELELDNGEIVSCAIITILTVDKKDYIVLLPLDENGNNEDGEVWFYRYFEDENNPNAEPSLSYIDNDEEYENVADAFDEYLDNVEFDEIVSSDEN